MLVIPAIDLKDGQAVRLYKGDYDQKTIYSTTPETIARGFEAMGARYLHVVDLDGAKDAQAANTETNDPISVQISSEAVAAKDEMANLAEMMHAALLEGAKMLENQGIIWYAEGESVEFDNNGTWTPCWHIQTDEDMATICLNYYGGPRVEVSASSLRRPREQS